MKAKPSPRSQESNDKFLQETIQLMDSCMAKLKVSISVPAEWTGSKQRHACNRETTAIAAGMSIRIYAPRFPPLSSVESCAPVGRLIGGTKRSHFTSIIQQANPNPLDLRGESNESNIKQ